MTLARRAKRAALCSGVELVCASLVSLRKDGRSLRTESSAALSFAFQDLRLCGMFERLVVVLHMSMVFKSPGSVVLSWLPRRQLLTSTSTLFQIDDTFTYCSDILDVGVFASDAGLYLP